MVQNYPCNPTLSIKVQSKFTEIEYEWISLLPLSYGPLCSKVEGVSSWIRGIPVACVIYHSKKEKKEKRKI
jgi:SPX domain protein involved in polyphosphate accumulation